MYLIYEDLISLLYILINMKVLSENVFLFFFLNYIQIIMVITPIKKLT